MQRDDDDLDAHPLSLDAHGWGEGEIERIEGEHAQAVADQEKRLAKLNRQIERTAILSATRAALMDKVDPRLLSGAVSLFREAIPLKVEIIDGAPQISALTPFGETTVEHAASAFLASELGAPFAPKLATHPGEWASAIRRLH